MADLDPTGATIQIGELGLRTPNLTGTADSVDAMAGHDRLLHDDLALGAGVHAAADG